MGLQDESWQREGMRQWGDNEEIELGTKRKQGIKEGGMSSSTKYEDVFLRDTPGKRRGRGGTAVIGKKGPNPVRQVRLHGSKEGKWNGSEGLSFTVWSSGVAVNRPKKEKGEPSGPGRKGGKPSEKTLKEPSISSPESVRSVNGE